MYCTHCGAKIDEGQKYCSRCGATVGDGEKHINSVRVGKKIGRLLNIPLDEKGLTLLVRIGLGIIALVTVGGFIWSLQYVWVFIYILQHAMSYHLTTIVSAFLREFVLLPIAGLAVALGYMAIQFEMEKAKRLFSIVAVCSILIPGVILIGDIVCALGIPFGNGASIFRMLKRFLFPFLTGSAAAFFGTYYLLRLKQIDPLPKGIMGAFDTFIDLVPGNFQSVKRNTKIPSIKGDEPNKRRKEKHKMVEYEYDEENLPEEYRPIKMWGYFGYQLLFSIPCIGLILLLVFAFGGTNNINLKNFARSYFCLLIVVFIITFIVIMSIGGVEQLYYYRYW